ncbi:hypothetical protein [Rhizobium halophilum]|nr:hypothetical protein [Rhizobium halophilum]
MTRTLSMTIKVVALAAPAVLAGCGESAEPVDVVNNPRTADRHR